MIVRPVLQVLCQKQLALLQNRTSHASTSSELCVVRCFAQMLLIDTIKLTMLNVKLQ
jgi:hypothetical protein